VPTTTCIISSRWYGLPFCALGSSEPEPSTRRLGVKTVPLFVPLSASYQYICDAPSRCQIWYCVPRGSR
jgi:hypothetical protein